MMLIKRLLKSAASVTLNSPQQRLYVNLMSVFIPAISAAESRLSK